MILILLLVLWVINWPVTKHVHWKLCSHSERPESADSAQLLLRLRLRLKLKLKHPWGTVGNSTCWCKGKQKLTEDLAAPNVLKNHEFFFFSCSDENRVVCKPPPKQKSNMRKIGKRQEEKRNIWKKFLEEELVLRYALLNRVLGLMYNNVCLSSGSGL